MRRLLEAIETVAALSMLLIAIVTAGNVALRDLLSVQIPDWFDGSKLLMAIALFWGIAVATYQGGHICVDVVWEHLRAPGRRVLDVVAAAITLAFLVPMAWMVWAKVMQSGTQATTDLRLPLVWFTSVAAAGGFAAVLLGAVRLVDLVRGRTRDPAPADATALDTAPDGP